MDKITLNMENLSEDEREQLIKLVEKANKKENSKVWKPEKGDYYWYIGETTISYLVFNNDRVDNFLYSIGNCFKTEKEAEFAVEKKKVIVELKQFAKENNEFKFYWCDYSQNKYFICYTGDTDSIEIYCRSIAKGNDVYFSSKEIARAAIETIGEDRLKKYYFEVEDL